MFWILYISSAIIAYVATWLSISISLRRGVLDLPNPRSSHTRPIPRIGGIGIVLGSCLPIAGLWFLGRLGMIDRVLQHRDTASILLAGTGMALTGLIDDLYGLDPGTKFVMQFVIAVLLVVLGVRVESVAVPFMRPLELGVLSFPLTILWLTGFSNVYNFMDGINGLAAGTGAIYGVFFFAFAAWQQNAELAAIAIIFSVSCLGFLFHNFPEARTFMGDSGSLFLGMVFALLLVRIAQQSANPTLLVAMLLVCSVYLYDATFTVLRRVVHRENIFQAHRSHLYQRLGQAGLSHVRITYLYLLLHALMGTVGLLYFLASDVVHLWILGFTLLAFLGFTLGVYWLERRTAEPKVRSEGESSGSLN